MANIVTNEAIADALKKSNGYIYLAAGRLSVAPKTIYRRLEKVAWLREYLEELRGRELDITEMQLHNAIMDGQGWAIALKLKTQGKSRGYVERVDVTSDNQKLENNVIIYLPDNGRN